MNYYERLVFNHRLGTINPDDGTMMYYLPLASGYWKTFGKPLDAFWCCTGTGSEEYAKLTDTIYFHNEDSLYVNQYIGSQLEWPEKRLRLKQETSFPEQQGTVITITADSPAQLAINLRIPYWVQNGSVKVNGAVVPAFSSPCSYLTLNRVWKSGDKIELNLPMGLHIDPMPDNQLVQAAMYGPLVLAGRFEPVTKEMTYGGEEPKPGDRQKVEDIIAADTGRPSWIEPDGSQPLVFHTVGQTQTTTLVPLYKIIHERYAVYWNVDSKTA
jgi:DUF1680 family protein